MILGSMSNSKHGMIIGRSARKCRKKKGFGKARSLGRKEETLAPLRVSVLGKAAATEIGVDGFHSTVCMDGCDRCCGKYLSCSTRWRCLEHGQQMRASPCFFIIPRCNTSERLADPATMVSG